MRTEWEEAEIGRATGRACGQAGWRASQKAGPEEPVQEVHCSGALKAFLGRNRGRAWASRRFSAGGDRSRRFTLFLGACH